MSPASSQGTRPASSGSHSAPAATPPGQFQADGDVHLLDRLAVLYRYRRIGIAVFILTSAAMMIQGYSTIQMFQSSGTLMIEDERATAVPGLNNTDNVYYEDPEPYYNTQFRILKGRDLNRRVIKKINLGSVPEFNGTAIKPSTAVTMLRDVQQRAISLVQPGKPAAIEPPRVDETPDESNLVSQFIGHVDVTPIRGSRLVTVSFTAMDPAFSAKACLLYTSPSPRDS